MVEHTLHCHEKEWCIIGAQLYIEKLKNVFGITLRSITTLHNKIDEVRLLYSNLSIEIIFASAFSFFKLTTLIIRKE